MPKKAPKVLNNPKKAKSGIKKGQKKHGPGRRLSYEIRGFIIRCVANYCSYHQTNEALQEKFGENISETTYYHYYSVQFEDGAARRAWWDVFIQERRTWARRAMCNPMATPQGLFETTARVVKKAEADGDWIAALSGIKVIKDMIDDSPIMQREILEALERSGGNVTGAARRLRVARSTLRHRMKKHNLK